MKLYRVRWRDGVWEALIGELAIAASQEREELVQLARTIAARQDGEVYVCTKNGKLEVSYIYTEGIETVRAVRSPRLRVVRNS